MPYGMENRRSRKTKLKKLKVAPKTDLPRIALDKKAETPEDEKPSSKLAKRMAEKQNKRSLGESLTDVAGAFPEGQGTVGNALKAGLSGAAAGATLGEALADMQKKKAQKGTSAPPRTVSENALAKEDEYARRKGKKKGRPESELD